MTPDSCAFPHNRPLSSGARTTPSHTLLSRMAVAAFVATLAATSGCEDKAVGRVCDLTVDGGVNQALYNIPALECPSRVCLRPAKDSRVVGAVDTTALCTAECSKDSDCDAPDEKRNKANGKDKRCVNGFICGIAFELGPLCCKKYCMCKDFLTIPAGGWQPPPSCLPTSPVKACANIQ